MKYSTFIQKTNFAKEEILAFGKGCLVEDPPEGQLALLPLPPFLMFDRIVKIERGTKTGVIIAEQDIKPEAWYFQCHFGQDPVQPGCLGLDAVWQLLGFFTAASGGLGSGRALGVKEVDFYGQIRPFDKLVTYELEVRRFSILKDSGAAIAIANGKVSVDGTQIYSIRDAKVGLFQDIAYHDYPNPDSRHARGGIMQRSV